MQKLSTKERVWIAGFSMAGSSILMAFVLAVARWGYVLGETPLVACSIALMWISWVSISISAAAWAYNKAEDARRERNSVLRFEKKLSTKENFWIAVCSMAIFSHLMAFILAIVRWRYVLGETPLAACAIVIMWISWVSMSISVAAWACAKIKDAARERLRDGQQ
jgi:cobalamin synthase